VLLQSKYLKARTSEFENIEVSAQQAHLIGYNTLSSYGSPAYYAQQIFSRRRCRPSSKSRSCS
jgi:hypothetical protein